MSLVLFKKSQQNKMVTLEHVFRDRLTFLGIQEILEPRGLKKAFTGLYVKGCRRIVMTPHREGAILIFSSDAKKMLMALDKSSRQKFFANLRCCNTAMLILPESRALPGPLKNDLSHYHLKAAVSFLHENLLESRIKAVIQEKIKKCVTVHGVALEIQGRGILITGASGVGKTTTALQAASEGCFWIADDLVVIKKSQIGQLMISGHRKIKQYFHTVQTGIVTVDSVLKSSQIKSKTRLAAVINVIRKDGDGANYRCIEKNIMETRLPLIQMMIPRTGFFNKNLLEEGLLKLKEVG
ncbi:MAG: HPr kinase/phosphorylase [Smithellaceae bacterium]